MSNPLDGRPDSYFDAPPDMPEESYTCPDCGERVDEEVVDCTEEHPITEVVDCADHAPINCLPEICEFKRGDTAICVVDRYRRALDRAVEAYANLSQRVMQGAYTNLEKNLKEAEDERRL